MVVELVVRDIFTPLLDPNCHLNSHLHRLNSVENNHQSILSEQKPKNIIAEFAACPPLHPTPQTQPSKVQHLHFVLTTLFNSSSSIRLPQCPQQPKAHPAQPSCSLFPTVLKPTSPRLCSALDNLYPGTHIKSWNLIQHHCPSP